VALPLLFRVVISGIIFYFLWPLHHGVADFYYE
jgi:hypothetical protein